MLVWSCNFEMSWKQNPISCLYCNVCLCVLKKRHISHDKSNMVNHQISGTYSVRERHILFLLQGKLSYDNLTKYYNLL